MREVKPTQKPVPSSDIKDLFFNSGLLDIWATSLERKYIDRFGNCHLTAAGMEWLFKELVEKFKVDMNTAIVASGYIPVDSFQQGADLPNNELTQRNHILRDEATGEYYRWDGDLPKQVLAGSTPQSTGGIGKGAWVSVGDASLRTQIGQGAGLSLVGGFSSIAELREFSGDVYGSGHVNLKSYYEGKNKGGGVFYYDAADTTSPDDGGMIIVDAKGKRYKRIERIFSLENFGGLPEEGFFNDDALDRIIEAYPDGKMKKPAIRLYEGVYHFKKKEHVFYNRKALFMSIHGVGMTATEIVIHSDTDDDAAFIHANDEACEFYDFAVTHLVNNEITYSKLNFIQSRPYDNMSDNDFVFHNIIAKGLNSVHKCYGRGHAHHDLDALGA